MALSQELQQLKAVFGSVDGLQDRIRTLKSDAKRIDSIIQIAGKKYIAMELSVDTPNEQAAKQQVSEALNAINLAVANANQTGEEINVIHQAFKHLFDAIIAAEGLPDPDAEQD